MLITLISPVFPHPQPGVQLGIERHIHEYASALIKQGHRVNLITTFWNGGCAREKYQGIEIYRVVDSYHRFGRLGRQFDLPMWTFSQQIKRLSEPFEDAAVVHAILPVYINDFLDKKGIPYVCHFHHREKVRKAREILKYPFANLNGKKVYRRCDAIVALSQDGKRTLEADWHIPTHLISIIPHGVDLGRYFPAKEEPTGKSRRLLYVGGLEKRKGVGCLLEAFRVVKQTKASLVLVGKGGERNRLEKMVRDFCLQDRVAFRGFLKEEDLISEYRSADIFVFPSYQEGFGIPLLEAMACGLPIISTDCSSIPEVVGDAAVLVEPGNPVQMAEAIDRLSEDPDLRRSLRRAGLERVKEKFSWEAVTNQFTDIYRKKQTQAFSPHEGSEKFALRRS